MDNDEIADDVCALPMVRRVAALLDLDVSVFRDGVPLPHGWHFLLFTPQDTTSALPADGYPSVMQGNGSTRVMLGGRRVAFQGELPIGARVHRTRRIVSVKEKSGRTGNIRIVTREHRIFADDATVPCIVEQEDMIQRGAPAAGANAPLRAPALRAAQHSRIVIPSEVLLFRYSAVTFNAHRIHFDHPYATKVERYKGLVVNGGLTALLLLQLYRETIATEPMHIDVRMLRPLFCGRAITLNLSHGGDGYELWATDTDLQTCMEMTIT
jgi:3-methylfumaryl-CoA hydratase